MGRPDKLTLEPHSDEEEAAINAGIAADPDNPELTDEDFARMRPVWAFPDLVDALGLNEGRREDRVEVTLALDVDLLERLRRAGDGWEDCANAMLRRGLGL